VVTGGEIKATHHLANLEHVKADQFLTALGGGLREKRTPTYLDRYLKKKHVAEETGSGCERRKRERNKRNKAHSWGKKKKVGLPQRNKQ